MGRPRNSRLDLRLRLFAGLGAIIGGFAGLLMGAMLTIPFAIFGLALGMGIGWILPPRPLRPTRIPAPSHGG